MGEYEPRNFLQPCLLLLLRERSDHGYDLVTRLRELHAADGDAGAVYRALRSLEKQGMVRSTWQTSDAGPARRTYQVTAFGRATLDRQADILEATHQTLHLFRERYRKLGTEHPPPGGVTSNGTAGNGATGNGTRNGTAGDGSGNGTGTRGVGTGGRREAHVGTAGGAHGDPGVRGVRSPRLPGPRTGR